MRDKVPSTVLNVATGTWIVSSDANDDAQVSFRFSAMKEIRSYMHPILKRKNFGTLIWY